MPKNRVSIKIERRGPNVAISVGGAVILLEPEEALEISDKIMKQSDKILRDSKDE